MRTQTATAFETTHSQKYEEKGLVSRRSLKPKRKGNIGGGKGQNIKPAIPGGVNMTVITQSSNPKAYAKHEAMDAWKAKRTWVVGQGWTLLEDDSEDDYDNGLDPARTHILGGVVDHGTHTTGVCSDECWCMAAGLYAHACSTKEGEEE
tara:strand:+ start:303 stop:749 length:447 start_codon:yes stop_codon:yes gene_type:complete